MRAGKDVRTVDTVRRQIERNFRWKDLRHTFASWLRRAGAELGVIGAMLGHRPGSPMTERYAHLTAGMKHEAVRRLSGIIPSCVEMPTGPTTGPTDTHPRVH